MIKPFLRKELMQRIHLHPSSANYEDFFVKFIPKSHMPSNYGGSLGTIEELHDQNRQLLIDMREYFIAEEDQMNFKFEDRVVEAPITDDDEDDFHDADDEWVEDLQCAHRCCHLESFVLNFPPLLINLISITWPSAKK